MVRPLLLVAMISGCASRPHENPAPAPDSTLSLNLTPGTAPARVVPQEEAEEEEKKTSETPSPALTPAAEPAEVSVRLVPAGSPAPPPKKHAIEIDASKAMVPTGPSYPDSDSNTIADVQVRMGVPGEQYGGVDPAKALRWLKNGNTRFLKNRLRGDGQTARDVARLAREAQKPHAIIFTCADAHAPPELVFDQKLGELYVLRNAGPSLDDGTLHAMEYAVDKLGTRLLVVLGHGGCAPPDRRPAAELWERVRGLGKDILARSSTLETAARGGKLSVVTAVYDVASGRVDFE